jgi:hypothetical protein
MDSIILRNTKSEDKDNYLNTIKLLKGQFNSLKTPSNRSQDLPDIKREATASHNVFEYMKMRQRKNQEARSHNRV